MGDDDLHVRVARRGPGRDQVDEDADLLEQKVEHGRRVAAQGQVVVGDGDGDGYDDGVGVGVSSSSSSWAWCTT